MSDKGYTIPLIERVRSMVDDAPIFGEILKELERMRATPLHSISLRYRNWRGEISDRTIIPFFLYWGKTEWHPELGWLLRAIDVEKGEERDFALKDCQFADLPKSTPYVCPVCRQNDPKWQACNHPICPDGR